MGFPTCNRPLPSYLVDIGESRIVIGDDNIPPFHHCHQFLTISPPKTSTIDPPLIHPQSLPLPALQDGKEKRKGLLFRQVLLKIRKMFGEALGKNHGKYFQDVGNMGENWWTMKILLGKLSCNHGYLMMTLKLVCFEQMGCFFFPFSLKRGLANDRDGNCSYPPSNPFRCSPKSRVRPPSISRHISQKNCCAKILSL